MFKKIKATYDSYFSAPHSDPMNFTSWHAWLSTASLTLTLSFTVWLAWPTGILARMTQADDGWILEYKVCLLRKRMLLEASCHDVERDYWIMGTHMNIDPEGWKVIFQPSSQLNAVAWGTSATLRGAELPTWVQSNRTTLRNNVVVKPTELLGGLLHSHR